MYIININIRINYTESFTPVIPSHLYSCHPEPFALLSSRAICTPVIPSHLHSCHPEPFALLSSRAFCTPVIPSVARDLLISDYKRSLITYSSKSLNSLCSSPMPQYPAYHQHSNPLPEDLRTPYHSYRPMQIAIHCPAHLF